MLAPGFDPARRLALVAATLAALVLAACGGDGGGYRQWAAQLSERAIEAGSEVESASCWAATALR